MSDMRLGRLDAQSRRAVREVWVQTLIGAVVMVVIVAVGLQPVSEVGAAAVRVFTFYSCIDCIRAARYHERLWSPSLTRWDQAAAYTVCAIAIDVIVRWRA